MYLKNDVRRGLKPRPFKTSDVGFGLFSATGLRRRGILAPLRG
jgi:hypothetical protein